jgi:hypothetical protein
MLWESMGAMATVAAVLAAARWCDLHSVRRG